MEKFYHLTQTLVEAQVLVEILFHLGQMLMAAPIQELVEHLIREIVSVISILQVEYS